MVGLPVPAHMQFSPPFDAEGRSVEQGRYAFGGRDRMDEQRDSSRTVRDERFRLTRHRHPDRSPLQHQYFAEKLPTWQALRTAVNDEARSRAAGLDPDRLTPLQRRITAERKPDRELYDLIADPHETVDLADDPAYADDAARLERALDEWLDRVGDQGEVPEDELARRWRPDGTDPVTATPTAVRDASGALVLHCATEGALIGWRADAPPAEPELTLQQRINGEPADPHGWAIYTGPLRPPHDGPVWARAWRLGGAASAAVRVDETGARS